MAAKNYLLFASERYALPILAPLQAAIEARGDVARWWCVGGATTLPIEPRLRVESAQQAVALQPQAVFSAANDVPYFVAGAKVQVFHGFNVEKRDQSRGHFRVRGWFDLYCTQGPATTAPFMQLAERLGHFAVVETGWPKLDPVFARARLPRPVAARGRPIILFGSTFTERLSAAPQLLETISQLVARGDRYWLLTLHPKCPPALFERYRALAGPNAAFVEPEQLMDAEASADVLLADTSSIVSEFIAQGKPVVTFRNRAPKPHMLDVREAGEVDAALDQALTPSPALRAEIERYAAAIHPYRDGHSAARVLAATDAFNAGAHPLRRRKPLNLLRKLRLRRALLRH